MCSLIYCYGVSGPLHTRKQRAVSDLPPLSIPYAPPRARAASFTFVRRATSVVFFLLHLWSAGEDERREGGACKFTKTQAESETESREVARGASSQGKRG